MFLLLVRLGLLVVSFEGVRRLEKFMGEAYGSGN